MADTSIFGRLSRHVARASGHPYVFVLAAASIAVWAALGPIFHFSDSWQLVINTATTIVTFLMVFLIQNSQNRDSEAIQVKLDELIRALEGAQNTLLGAEEMTQDELDKMKSRYEAIARAARSELGSEKLASQ